MKQLRPQPAVRLIAQVDNSRTRWFATRKGVPSYPFAEHQPIDYSFQETFLVIARFARRSLFEIESKFAIKHRVQRFLAKRILRCLLFFLGIIRPRRFMSSSRQGRHKPSLFASARSRRWKVGATFNFVTFPYEEYLMFRNRKILFPRDSTRRNVIPIAVRFYDHLLWWFTLCGFVFKLRSPNSTFIQIIRKISTFSHSFALQSCLAGYSRLAELRG